jgi:hypothetical protein
VNFTVEITKENFLFSITTIMKKYYLLLCMFLTTSLLAQVGINTTTPNAQLDIRSSNQTTPSNTDGMLIPKVDTFPATNPTIAQQGMLVYLTTNVGSNQPGFYYWNNPTTSWIPIKGNDTGTLDQAYDFGGAGNGRTITADAGAVLINGTDGLVSTGTLNSGAIAPSGAGVKMFWNPRKAAFRAGNVSGTQWNDANVGQNSIAFGVNTIASGNSSVAIGNSSLASGISSVSFRGNASGASSTSFGGNASGSNSTSFGSGTNATGSNSFVGGFVSNATGSSSFAFGSFSDASGDSSASFGGTASGFNSFSLGIATNASGFNSTVMGSFNSSVSQSETVIGIGATTYTPSLNGDSQFRIANATDRLFVIGNAIDSNNNNTVDPAERSDAMVVLKNGATGIGSSTPEALLDIDSNDKGVMVPRVTLTSANVASPIINPSGGALPESTLVYNTTTSGVGVNEVTPGFHYWNGTKWIKLEENNGKTKYYTALGTTNAVSTLTKSLMPEMEITFTPKSNIILVNFSASGFQAQGQTPIFFDVLLNGTIVKGFQTSVEDIVGGTNRPIWDINFSYPVSVTPFVTQTISINWATINTVSSNFVQTPASYAGPLNVNAHRVLTVIDPEGGGGIVTPVVPPITNEYWNIHGNTGTNPTANFIGTSDAQPLVFKTNNVERMRIFNGNLGIGTIAPTAPLEVIGNIRMVDGNQQAGRVLTSSATGLASWQDLNTWSVLGNAGTNPATNFIGTSDNQSFVFRTNNLERMRLDANGNFGVGTNLPTRSFHVSNNSTSTTNGQLYLEQQGTGDALIHIGNTGGRHFNLGLDTSAESFKIGTSATTATAVTTSTLMTLQPTGEVGIGTTTPDRKAEISNAGLVYQRITNTLSTDVGIEFKRSGSDWQIRNSGGLLFVGQSVDDLVTVTDVLRLGGSSVTPASDNTVTLGNSSLKWTAVFATNGTIQTSDANDKKNMFSLHYGLDKIKQLRPISFQWKDNAIDNSATHLGFVAQEVQEVLPEVIVDSDWVELPEGQGKTWKKSDKLGMKYSEIIPVLVKATQEQQEIIENQNSEIEILKNQLQMLIDRIETLEKK